MRLIELTDSELFWLAGLLEGEGSFMAPSPSEPFSPSVRVEMTDRDVIERAADLLGAERIRTKTAHRAHWADVYEAEVRGEKALPVLRTILPLLGERRSAKCQHAIELAQAVADDRLGGQKSGYGASRRMLYVKRCSGHWRASRAA